MARRSDVRKPEFTRVVDHLVRLVADVVAGRRVSGNGVDTAVGSSCIGHSDLGGGVPYALSFKLIASQQTVSRMFAQVFKYWILTVVAVGSKVALRNDFSVVVGLLSHPSLSGLSLRVLDAVGSPEKRCQ